MALERSPRGKKAKSVFFESFNDIDIYVEDTCHGTKKLYTAIFERAMNGVYRIETVFPLGGKNTVISQCANDQGPGGRRRLYVVDGDLALLTGGNPNGMRRLLVLSRYSIENYLVDEDAIIGVLDEEDLERNAADIRVAFAFPAWRSANETELFHLFVLYAIASEVVPTCATVSYPVNTLIASDLGVIDSEKVTIRTLEIENRILNSISRAELDSRKRRIAELAERSSGDLLSYISGKDYLMPLLLMRMRKLIRLRADNGVLKQRLAMKCDVTELAAACEIVS